jgi:hypothetical protein
VSPARHDTPGGHAYLRLQALARQADRPTQELLVNYVLERFLRRIASSDYQDRLVLKGGMLLAALGTRRPTADIDLLALSLSNDIDSVAAMVREIVAIDLDDGVTYQPSRLTRRQIRDADLYTGVRLAVPAAIDRARTVLRLDVNVGDPVTPAPERIEYPELLGGSFPILGYPPGGPTSIVPGSPACYLLAMSMRSPRLRHLPRPSSAAPQRPDTGTHSHVAGLRSPVAARSRDRNR